jgi:gliding motility-associated-like protein
MKLAFNLAGTNVNVSASPRSTGCVPLTVNFHSVLVNVVNVTWNFGDGTFSHSYNPTHTFVDTGTYTVMLIGTDSASCNIVDTAYLSVEVRDDSITANFIPNLNIDCHNRVFSSKVHNYPTTTYLWNFGDGNTATTDSVYHVYAAAGTYHVTLHVSDPNSCNGLNNYDATIVIKPFAYLNTTLRDTSGCFPLRLHYVNSTSSTGPFLWTFGDGTSSTLASPSHTYVRGGSYQITLTMDDSSKCNIVDTMRANVRVYDDTVTPLYSVRRLFYGCDSVEVILQSFNTTANRIIWDLGDGTRSSAFVLNHVYRDSGRYTITYIVIDSTKFCRIADTLHELVSLNPIVASFGISDTNGCIPLTVGFSDSSGYATAMCYWNFGDGASDTGLNVTHTYTPVNRFRVQHIIIDSSVCNFADTTYGYVRTRNDSTQAYFDGTILNACDSQLIIQFNNHSIDATQYEWHFGDGAVSSLTNPLHTYTLPGTYQVMMISIDTNKCHPRDTAYSSYIMKPNAIADFDVLPVACSGVSVTFNNHSHLGAAFTWFFGDSTHANGYNVSHTYSASGNYTITMIIADTSTCNTFDTITRNIQILDFPHADFVMDRDSFYYLDQIQFTNRSIHFTDLLWRFGDGDTSVDIDPMHQYQGIFHQHPCVIAYINGTGCADTFCRDIFIHYDPIIGVPNAFSPNGDGVNDEVRVEGSGIVELDFRIYNRWGEQVFRSTEKSKGWNGIYKGVLQEMDVYVYSVQAKFLDNSRKSLTGNITLLR